MLHFFERPELIHGTENEKIKKLTNRLYLNPQPPEYEGFVTTKPSISVIQALSDGQRVLSLIRSITKPDLDDNSSLVQQISLSSIDMYLSVQNPTLSDIQQPCQANSWQQPSTNIIRQSSTLLKIKMTSQRKMLLIFTLTIKDNLFLNLDLYSKNYLIQLRIKLELKNQRWPQNDV